MMFRIGGGIRVNSRFAASLSDRSFVLATSSSLPLPLPLKQQQQRHQQQSCQRIGKTSYYVRRTFSSSSSSGTWNWSNFAAAATDKKENNEGASNDSQESQVLKKTAELYMSLMPLNKKVGKLRLFLQGNKEWYGPSGKTLISSRDLTPCPIVSYLKTQYQMQHSLRYLFLINTLASWSTGTAASSRWCRKYLDWEQYTSSFCLFGGKPFQWKIIFY